MHAIHLLKGIGIGSALMYFWDPDLGRRRRSLIRDQLVRATNELECGLDKAIRDFGNRTEGFAAEIRGTFSRRDAADDVLVERLRSKLGRYVSHPRAIEVRAQGGHVELCGPILSDEVESLVAAVRKVPGVQSVDNCLDVHQSAGNFAALQGGSNPLGERWNIAEANWAPGTRLSLAAAGGALLALGLTQRFPVACLLGTIGLGTCIASTGHSSQGRQHRRGSQPDRVPKRQLQSEAQQEEPQHASAPQMRAGQAPVIHDL